MTEMSATICTELANRSGDGMEVTLRWSPANGRDGEGEVVICICDTREGADFGIPAEPHLALNVYYHPYAYKDFSTVDYRDSCLAA